MVHERLPIISLPSAQVRPGARVSRNSLTCRSLNPQCEENVSTTCKNQRLRQQRHVNWRKADAIREYWRASLQMNGAISRVQSHMPEGDLHAEVKPDDRWTILAKYRAAIMQQLLTPASTVAEVTWKRAAFKAGQHRHTDVKPERIERAIADDVEFLRTHPARRPLGSNSNA
jgi:hypothetical protein